MINITCPFYDKYIYPIQTHIRVYRMHNPPLSSEVHTLIYIFIHSVNL